jgi:predicted protein tyrosine phosphatase
MIHVCPLSRLEETVRTSGAAHVISLLAEGTALSRPPSISAENHLHLSMHDIAEARDGLTLPGEIHVSRVIDFARAWDRSRPMVVHCYAGISRSTASAFIVAAALDPHRDEMALARLLRERSPSATPNPRLVAIADDLLSRNGRMVDAIRSIGRGADAFEGTPFVLPLD